MEDGFFFSFLFLFLFNIAISFPPFFETINQPYSILLPPRLVGGNNRLWDGDAL